MIYNWLSRVTLAILVAAVPHGVAGGAEKPAPTKADVAYGPHKRNVLDFWQADRDAPTPLVIYIHGGGFVGGSKEKLSARSLEKLLDAGISVASLNYRFVRQAPLPASHHDCRRALQFLRSHAEEWNLDKARVGAFGSSAGAQICMYLAFHDDMAKRASDDPIERESTRLKCVATQGGQTTVDVDWWLENLPGYTKPHVDFYKRFGANTEAEYRAKIPELSALSLISKEDPPIFMAYRMKPDAPIPSDPKRVKGWAIHHVAFGSALKKRMDELGVEAELHYPGAETKHGSIVEFLIAKLSTTGDGK